MKKSRKFLSFLLSVVMGASVIGGLSSCTPAETGPGEVRIWSTYNTLKVLRDYEGPPADGGKYPDLGVKIDVLMALGETEGAQLMVTPEKAVDSVVLTPGVMRNADGDIFPADDITVYYQYYIEVVNKTNGQQNYNYPAGWTPDMIVPMDLVVKAGENKIGAGHNQGFTIEFTTTSDTKPGTYTGTFTLNVDGKITPVPATVVVENVDITKCHGYTSIWTFGRLSAEFDGELSNTTYRAYYETSLNDYKFCMQEMPNYDDPVLMAQEVIRYWDNPNFTSYGIPSGSYHLSANDVYVRKGNLFDYIYNLAINSTPDRILTQKGYVTVLVDEPAPAEYESCMRFVTDVYEVEEMVIDALVEEGFYDKFPQNPEFRTVMEKELRSITVHQTSNANQLSVMGDKIQTYISHVYKVATQAMREPYYEVREKNKERGGELWFYTCMEPIYPHPTDHMDDYAISIRTMRWMQKDWDYDGYLHWTFFYNNGTGSLSDAGLDAYTEANRFNGYPGDGFKTYPGKKYGLETYLPSIRLATFRDGQEDYNMLCEIDESVAENEAFYGIEAGSVDTSFFVKDLYSRLYTGSIYNPDDANFYEVKSELFEIAKFLCSDSKFLATHKILADQNKYQSTIYLNDGYTIKVNGNELTAVGKAGSGKKYIVEQPLDQEVSLDIEIYKDGQLVNEFDMFVAGATVKVDISENNNPLSVTPNSTLTYNGDGSATVTLQPYGDSIIDILSNTPALSLDGVVNLTTVDTVTFDLTNEGDTDIKVLTRISAGFNNEKLVEYIVPAHSTITANLSGIYAYGSTFNQLANAKVQVYVDNAKPDSTLADPVTFKISSLSYGKIKQGE